MRGKPMEKDTVYARMMRAKAEQGGAFLLLIDPDKIPARNLIPTVEAAESCGVDALLVGTSFVLNGNWMESTKQIKSASTLPVIIFPGSFAQITPYADAILFSSLISGRNPNYLIDEQMKGAPLVKRVGLEPIPTAYMLIESGTYTSVQYISNTEPIPRTKHDIACAHALAAQYLGMKLVYLEAGSGAANPVPVDMIREVANYADIPIIVGGGLRTPNDVASRIEAGASFVVMGNSLETDPDFSYLRELTAAAHPKTPVIA